MVGITRSKVIIVAALLRVPVLDCWLQETVRFICEQVFSWFRRYTPTCNENRRAASKVDFLLCEMPE